MPEDEVSEQVACHQTASYPFHICTLCMADLLTLPIPPMHYKCVCMYVYILVCVFLSLQQALLSLHKLCQQVTSQCAHRSAVSDEVDLRVCVLHVHTRIVHVWVYMHLCHTSLSMCSLETGCSKYINRQCEECSTVPYTAVAAPAPTLAPAQTETTSQSTGTACNLSVCSPRSEATSCK